MQPSFQEWLNRGSLKANKRKRLAPISERNKKRMAEYKRVEAEHLKDNPVCQVGQIIRKAGYSVRCLGRATHCHHVRGRLGKYLCDRRYLKSSCSGDCHPLWVHRTHLDIARKIGLVQYA